MQATIVPLRQDARAMLGIKRKISEDFAAGPEHE